MIRLHPALTRRLLAFCLPLLMLLAQQGAVLHELGHLRTDDGQASEVHKHAKAETSCALCLAYAAIGGAVAPDAPQALLAQFGQAAYSAPVAGHAPTDAPVPRSRAPPLLA